MIIMFDLWVLDPEKMQHASYEEDLLLKTIFDFVYDRIMILEDEVNKEEEGREEGECCIMIEIIKQRVSYHGYSPELTDKLKACFNENDSKILGKRLDEAFVYIN